MDACWRIVQSLVLIYWSVNLVRFAVSGWLPGPLDTLALILLAMAYSLGELTKAKEG